MPPRKQIDFAVRCDAATADCCDRWSLTSLPWPPPGATGWGPEVVPPKLSANVALAGMEVFVDLADLIDVGAEVERTKQEMVRLEGFIAAKRKKLENANFVQRAPAAVVEGERAALEGAWKISLRRRQP